MDWNDLRIFLAVAEVGSLAGAARRLRLSHATAWRRIGALERALQVALFERRAGGYVLTPAGLRFLEGISGVERTVDAACRQLTQAAAVAEGEVRIAAPEFVGAMLADGLGRLQQRHPRLVLELLTGSPAASLLARDVDIALRVERLPAGGLVPEATFSIPCGLYASPAYLRRFGAPPALDDLSGHRLVDFDRSIAHIAPRPWLRAGGRGAEVAFRSNSPHARMAAARAGLGLAMLPDPIVARRSGLRRVIGSDQVGGLDLMLFVNAGLRREPRITAARDHLVELLAAYAVPAPARKARSASN
ncbi:MAG TPA: LysR family transcriptional regulator [Candidatus Acidoferrum sp.]|nr:LysR family transcriptional regulator [Candidatus Acidoferrum sp.]